VKGFNVNNNRKFQVSRRTFVTGSAGLALTAALPLTSVLASNVREYHISAAPGRAALAGKGQPDTSVWCFNGTMPGPEMRVRQGERLRVKVTNQLKEETTVHWHGLRVPNAMDGVPHLTQKPIAPGETFTYEFDVPDAGTYWYHPHQRGFEQVGRGLYGPLIIEEREPVKVDRDIVWVLDDWRLLKDAQISDDFGNLHDISHNGRLGNTVTINGRDPDALHVRTGERVRIRLINAANARIFGLNFASHNPKIIALDGQPVEPFEPGNGMIVLGPAMRVDIILDMTEKPGERFIVTDNFYKRLKYRLVNIVYGPEPLRNAVPDTPITLTANVLPEPDLKSAKRHEIRFNGGMMGGMMMGSDPGSRKNMMNMMREGKVWFINGVAASGHVMDPIITLAKGSSYILAMQNDTAWHHPIHLHGHSFRVVSRNGNPAPRREWQDTVLMAPRENVEIAFVADNPGSWMFHCHILEHMAGGMMGVIRVA
jgi:FtsP/CotA-like multicopper oxidase with cupredoxin domain